MLSTNGNTIRAIGIIGEEVDADEFYDAIAEQSGPFTVRLNSKGGVIEEGLRMLSYLQEVAERATVHVEAEASSIASVLMLGADKITANESARFMVHNAWTIAAGDAEEFRGLADELESRNRQIAEVYAARAGGTVDHWLKVMDGGEAGYTTFTAREAMNAGLVDEVIPHRARRGKMAAMVAMATDPPVAKTGPMFVASAKAREIRRRMIDGGHFRD